MSKWNEIYGRIVALPLMAVVALAFSSCGDDGSGLRSQTGREVYIRASIGDTPSGRGPYEPTAPSVDAPLDARVWASETSRSYASGIGLNESTVSTTVRFLSGEPQLIGGLEYPADGKELYFVAMHPKSGWAARTEGAYFTFDGTRDLMFAKETSGHYGEKASPLPKLVFKHMLTWLRVKLRAEDQEAVETWGKLKSMKIKSLNEVGVSLNTAEPSFYFGGSEVYFDFHDAATDAVFPGDDDTLPVGVTKAKEAYVLCAPITVGTSGSAAEGTGATDNRYVIILETDNRTVKLPVDMTAIGTESFTGGSTMGHQFTLNVCLKLGFTITTEASVDDWVYGGSAFTEVEQ